MPELRLRLLGPGGPLPSPVGVRAGVLAAAASLALLAPLPIRAQEPTQPVAPPLAARHTTAQDSTAQARKHKEVTPGGAFLRAALVPGWGHSAIGSYKRGAFYFAVEGMTAWEIVRTGRRLKAARRLATFRDGVLRGDLAAQGITDPGEVQDSLSADAKLSDLDSLVSARKSQKEDWTAVGIFLVFLSGADAFVSAHLQHFPVPVSVEARPAGGGRMDLALSVKLPSRRLSPPRSSGTEAIPPPTPGTSGSAPNRPN